MKGFGVRRAVCPGSFDPVTNGHLDIIARTAGLFDEVVVAIGVNKSKASARLFTAEERMEMIREAVKDYDNVTVAGFEGLLTTFCEQNGIKAIVKGLRAVSDFDYELQMAQMNSAISGVQTLFIPSASSRSFIASKLIREIARFGGDVGSMVPEPVAKRLREKYGSP